LSGYYDMLSLGPYTFGIPTAAYQEFKRNSEWLWPSQQRFGNRPAVQHTGKGDETISLPGVIFPEWNGGTTQLDQLRDLADEAQPQTLIDGRGNVLGQWVITAIEESGSNFAQAGVARKQEFTISLKWFGEGGEAAPIVGAAISAVTGGASGLPAVPSALSTAADMVKTVTATANAALSTATRLQAGVGAALSSVSSVASAMGVHAPIVTNALNRSMAVVNSIRASTSGALDTLARVQSAASSTSAIQQVYDDASGLAQPAMNAGRTIKSSLASLTAAGADQAAIDAATGAMIAANKTTSLASQLRDSANTILGRIGG
jgi:phage protein U